MALSYEANTDLAFDTTVFRDYGKRYHNIADELRTMASDLNGCLAELKASGWTTPAANVFYDLSETNWEQNIKKYADLLDTLKAILDDAATQYEKLSRDHIAQVKL